MYKKKIQCKAKYRAFLQTNMMLRACHVLRSEISSSERVSQYNKRLHHRLPKDRSSCRRAGSDSPLFPSL